MLRSLHSFPREQDGATLIEFALCITALLTVVFGIMDLSRALYTDHFVVMAARQATRYAIVRGADFSGTACTTVTTANCDATQANIINYVDSLAPAGTKIANLTIAASWPGTDGSGATCTNAVRVSNSYGCLVTVKVKYAYTFSLPFLPKNAMSLQSTSSMTISQ
ncbi:TadE/TadG family type IV pilus assembly protein [Granulicella paludicola]|uniref:TadE/TadG family type IV pilus assembly protein n=1 Tax=Granulicella paludicola TaxID=474951 RepID=UPI0021E0F120|nr:TadE/TadG family type IV pilus assembly protein [Granulicella paludicola]